MLLNCDAGEDSWESLKIPPARRSNQSILKEVSPEYSLEGLMWKLKLQYFGCLMWRADSLERTLILGEIEGKRRSGWQRMRLLASLSQWTWVWANFGRQWRTGKPGVLRSMGLQRIIHDLAIVQQQNWRIVVISKNKIFIWLHWVLVACKLLVVVCRI